MKASLTSTNALRRGTRRGRRAPLERMAVAYGWLIRGERVTSTRLGQHFELSSKTAQRDLEFLRDRLGVPFEWDARRGTYVCTPGGKRPWWLELPEPAAGKREDGKTGGAA